MDKYKVEVFVDGSIHRELNNEPHCSTGPASEYPSGYKSWWLNGEHLSERAFKESKWIDTE